MLGKRQVRLSAHPQGTPRLVGEDGQPQNCERSIEKETVKVLPTANCQDLEARLQKCASGSGAPLIQILYSAGVDDLG